MTPTIAAVSDLLSVPDTRARSTAPLEERETLIAFLDYYRETILVKLDGLDREQLTRRLVPTRTTLLSVLKHLVDVERWWFVIVFSGEPLDPNVPAGEDEDAEFLITDDDTAEGLVAAYRGAYARSNDIVRAAGSLDETGPGPKRADRSLRWILVHMIEETARHAGHMDILRELIDGRTGD